MAMIDRVPCDAVPSRPWRWFRRPGGGRFTVLLSRAGGRHGVPGGWAARLWPSGRRARRSPARGSAGSRGAASAPRAPARPPPRGHARARAPRCSSQPAVARASAPLGAEAASTRFCPPLRCKVLWSQAESWLYQVTARSGESSYLPPVRSRNDSRVHSPSGVDEWRRSTYRFWSLARTLKKVSSGPYHWSTTSSTKYS